VTKTDSIFTNSLYLIPITYWIKTIPITIPKET